MAACVALGICLGIMPLATLAGDKDGKAKDPRSPQTAISITGDSGNGERKPSKDSTSTTEGSMDSQLSTTPATVAATPQPSAEENGTATTRGEKGLAEEGRRSIFSPFPSEVPPYDHRVVLVAAFLSLLASLVTLVVICWWAFRGEKASSSSTAQQEFSTSRQMDTLLAWMSELRVEIFPRLDALSREVRDLRTMIEPISRAVAREREAAFPASASRPFPASLSGSSTSPGIPYPDRAVPRVVTRTPEPPQRPSADATASKLARLLGALPYSNPVHQDCGEARKWVEDQTTELCTLDPINWSGTVVRGAQKALVVYPKLAKKNGFAIASPETETDGHTLSWFDGLGTSQVVRSTPEPAQVEFAGNVWTVKTKGRIS